MLSCTAESRPRRGVAKGKRERPVTNSDHRRLRALIGLPALEGRLFNSSIPGFEYSKPQVDKEGVMCADKNDKKKKRWRGLSASSQCSACYAMTQFFTVGGKGERYAAPFSGGPGRWGWTVICAISATAHTPQPAEGKREGTAAYIRQL